MTSLYKHTEGQYAEDMVNRGRFLLQPLSIYRNYDLRAMRGIADPTEMQFTRFSQISSLHDPAMATPEDEHVLDKLGLGKVQCVGLTISNCTMTEPVTIPSYLVLCVSSSPSVNISPHYDAIVEICDVSQFSIAITAALMRTLPCKDVFPPEPQACIYRDGKVLQFNESFEKGAYVMPLSKQSQQEWRFVWRELIDQEPVVIESRAAARFCRRVR